MLTALRFPVGPQWRANRLRSLPTILAIAGTSAKTRAARTTSQRALAGQITPTSGHLYQVRTGPPPVLEALRALTSAVAEQLSLGRSQTGDAGIALDGAASCRTPVCCYERHAPLLSGRMWTADGLSFSQFQSAKHIHPQKFRISRSRRNTQHVRRSPIEYQEAEASDGHPSPHAPASSRDFTRSPLIRLAGHWVLPSWIPSSTN